LLLLVKVLLFFFQYVGKIQITQLIEHHGWILQEHFLDFSTDDGEILIICLNYLYQFAFPVKLRDFLDHFGPSKCIYKINRKKRQTEVKVRDLSKFQRSNFSHLICPPIKLIHMRDLVAEILMSHLFVLNQSVCHHVVYAIVHFLNPFSCLTWRWHRKRALRSRIFFNVIRCLSRLFLFVLFGHADLRRIEAEVFFSVAEYFEEPRTELVLIIDSLQVRLYI